MKRLRTLALFSVLLVGCASFGTQCASQNSGRPTEHDMGNGIKCYTFTQSSLACVQTK